MKDNQYGEKLISWQFPEFTEHVRSKAWYIVTIIIGLILVLYSVLTQNFLFAMILVIVAIIMFMRKNQGAKIVNFAIYEDGIKMGDTFIDFKEINNFYIIYEPPEVKNLYFTFKSFYQPRITIPLDDINPLKVREFLLDYIDEDLDQEGEPWSDGLSRILKL